MLGKSLDEFLCVKYRANLGDSPYGNSTSSLVLSTEPENFTAPVSAPRGRDALANEYFAQEVFSALGMPIPYSIILCKNEDLRQMRFCSQKVKTNTVRSVDYSYQYPRESMFTQFLAEAIILDGDGIASSDEGDHQWVEKDLSLVRVTYDRERASRTKLEKHELAQKLETLRNVHVVRTESGEIIAPTLEQELSMIAKMMQIQKENTLSKIFHEPRVQATDQFKPPFIDETYLQDLESAWQSNIRLLCEHYAKEMDGFQEREKIREELIDNIIKQLIQEFPEMANYFNSSEYKQEFLERLRTSQYFDPAHIKEKQSEVFDLNSSLAKKILNEEHKRACLVVLSQNFDKRILTLLNDPVIERNPPKYAKALYQRKNAFLKEIVREKTDQQGRLNLSSADMQEITLQFNKEIEYTKNHLIQDENQIEEAIELIASLVNEKMEMEALYSRVYGENEFNKNQKVNEYIKQNTKELKEWLAKEFAYQFLQNREDMCVRLLEFKPDETFYTQFQPQIMWNGLPGITETGNIVDKVAAQRALAPFIFAFKKQTLRDPNFAVEEHPFGLFSQGVPADKEERIEFLKGEIALMFEDMSKADVVQHMDVHDLATQYRKVQKFLTIADAKFNNMVARLQLAENELNFVQELFNERKKQLAKQWEELLPKIKDLMARKAATDRIATHGFLADLFPSSWFPNNEHIGLRAFSAYEALHRFDNETSDTHFRLCIDVEGLGLNAGQRSNEDPPKGFNPLLGEACVQYYKDLFHAYAKSAGDIPTITLIPPKTDREFHHNLYLINIEFKNKAQKEWLLYHMSQDCYDPKLARFGILSHDNINPNSLAAQMHKKHAKYLAKLSAASFIPPIEERDAPKRRYVPMKDTIKRTTDKSMREPDKHSTDQDPKKRFRQ